jgi:uncharacterized protein (DUF2141 family)
VKHLIRNLLLPVTVFLFLSFNHKKKEETFSLTIEVDGLRNSKGVVQFSLYNKDGTIPDEHFKKYFKKEVTGISGDKATVTFFNLPEGKYAVNVLHDENKNGKIDKSFLMPKEGVGFSNYTSIGLSNRPKFSKASFGLDSDSEIKINIIYM